MSKYICKGHGKDQPQFLWDHQRWSLLLSSPNLSGIKVKKGELRFRLHLGEIYLQLFHPIQQSSAQAKAGKQEGILAGQPVPLNNRYSCFGLLAYSWVRLKFLLVFRRAMSLTCLVKLKSLWRTTSVTWSSLVVVRMHSCDKKHSCGNTWLLRSASSYSAPQGLFWAGRAPEPPQPSFPGSEQPSEICCCQSEKKEKV